MLKILLSMQLNQRIEMSYQAGQQWSWYLLLYVSCDWSNLLLVCLACVGSETSYIVFGEASHIWQVECSIFLGHSNLVYSILNFLQWCPWDAWSPCRGKIHLFNFSFYLSVCQVIINHHLCTFVELSYLCKILWPELNLLIGHLPVVLRLATKIGLVIIETKVIRMPLGYWIVPTILSKSCKRIFTIY